MATTKDSAFEHPVPDSEAAIGERGTCSGCGTITKTPTGPAPT